MRHRDLIGSLFWMATGVIFAIGAPKYGLFKSGIPGAGFFPFLGAIVLISLSLISIIVSFSRGDGEGKTVEAFLEKEAWRRLGLALLSLFAYGICLVHLGFLVTSFLLLIFLLKFIEPQSWLSSIAFAFLSAGASFLLFDLLLKTTMPRGVLGI